LAFTVAVPVFTICRSATGLIVVLAELVLLFRLESVTPDGVVTVAVLVIVPLVPAVPVSVKVTLLPLGKIGIVSVPACKADNAGLTGHDAPPVSEPQVTVPAVKLATAGSLIVALLAPDRPLLVTTMV
jgi:hypothetical protein